MTARAAIIVRYETLFRILAAPDLLQYVIHPRTEQK